MAKSKLQQLSVLSPLALAIAFSTTMSSQALAAKFVIKSQEDLDDAVDAIWEAEGDSHTITFDSSLSGEHLTLNSLRLYGEGALVIDGADAKDIELGILERDNAYYGIRLNDDSELTLKNLNILEGGNAPTGYIVQGRGDSQITITNTHVTAASFSDSSGESRGAIEAEGLTIKDSSFTGLSGPNLINVDNSYSYEATEQTVSITNTSFSDNYIGWSIVNVDSRYYGTENTSVTIAGSSFDSNETLYGTTVWIGAYSRRYGGELTVDATIANTSFTNNSSGYGVIGFEARSNYSADYDAVVNANLANITVANNLTDGTAVGVWSYDSSNEEGEGTSFLSLNMAHATIVNNGSDGELEDSDFRGGFGFEAEGFTPWEGTEIEVNIINSIISGNTMLQGRNSKPSKERSKEIISIDEDELEIVDADFYSKYDDANVDNTLVGVEYQKYDEEAEEYVSTIAGKNNLIGVDPMLGELTLDSNTGTMYMKPKSGSPVINAGTDKFNAEVAQILDVKVDELIDQLGKQRVNGAAPDMGAVEKTKSGSSSSSGVFGSLGFGSLLAGLGLAGIRRKRK